MTNQEIRIYSRSEFKALFSTLTSIIRSEIVKGNVPSSLGGKSIYSFIIRTIKTSIGLSADLSVDDMSAYEVTTFCEKIDLIITLCKVAPLMDCILIEV